MEAKKFDHSPKEWIKRNYSTAVFQHQTYIRLYSLYEFLTKYKDWLLISAKSDARDQGVKAKLIKVYEEVIKLLADYEKSMKATLS